MTTTPMSDKVRGSGYFSYLNNWLHYRRMIPFYDAALFCFVFLDLLTTGIGLVWGLRESAPGTYIFGSLNANPILIITWLFVQKFIAFHAFEWLIMRFSPDYMRRDHLIAMYSILMAFGLAVSIDNAGHLWRFLVNG